MLDETAEFAPRLRVDVVVNNLLGYAHTIGEILMQSDGTPWRPLVHVEDLSRALLAALEAPRELVHDEPFKVGGNEENHRIREVAEICESEFAEHGLVTRFVQASTVFTASLGTVRGLHYQEAPHREVKLVRCTSGAAHVVIVDLRPGSPTFTRWLGVELDSSSGRLRYVPERFAQGYQTVVDGTEMSYQMSHEYVPSAARGVRWDDPAFGVERPDAERRLLSEGDRSWPDYAGSPGS
jgi:dTDP-4-dehydrorhamnose 3,5-epimerase